MVKTLLAAAAITAIAVVGLGQATAASKVRPSNTSRPTISGTPEEGRTLTASTGTWTGTPPITFDYQWQRCLSTGESCSLIPGATSQTYTLTRADVDRRIRVVVNARNADGSAQARSAATALVKAAPQNAPRNTSRPQITGEEIEGRTLTATSGTWSGTQPITFAYQWLRCNTAGGSCTVVAGATSRTYTLTADDVGRRMRATVTATNSLGAASETTSASDTVRAAPATSPRNTAPPTISGTAREGQTLTASPGTWSGTTPITYTFQWLRCDGGGGNCAAISAATGQTYTVASADVGQTLRVLVAARNAAGTSSVQSLATPRVAGSGGGGNAVPASSVELPTRFIIDRVAWSPNPVRSRDTVITGRIHVTTTKGDSVRDARVLVTGLPYGWITPVGETATDGSGWATVQFRLTAKAPRRGALVMFLRARKLGDNLLAGVSTRRLVQMRIALS